VNSKELGEQIQALGTPFWLALDSGEQVCCQAILSLDGATITVLVGAEPRMYFVHQVRQCSKLPVTSKS